MIFLILSSADVEVPEQVDKSALEALLNNREDTTNWTTESANAYNAAIEAGQKVFDSADADQTSVDNAVAAIQNAVANKVLKGDVSKLQAALDNAIKDGEGYTEDSWKAYSDAVSAIEAAMKNADNLSEKDVEKLLADLAAAEKNLVKKPVVPEKVDKSALEKYYNECLAYYKEADYTADSWKVYASALANAKAVIDDKDATKEAS